MHVCLLMIHVLLMCLCMIYTLFIFYVHLHKFETVHILHNINLSAFTQIMWHWGAHSTFLLPEDAWHCCLHIIAAVRASSICCLPQFGGDVSSACFKHHVYFTYCTAFWVNSACIVASKHPAKDIVNPPAPNCKRKLIVLQKKTAQMQQNTHCM